MGKTEVECCDVTCIHNENVKLALEQMPDEELLNSLADFYKAFADGTRVKILYVLQKSEMCVCVIWRRYWELHSQQSPISFVC